MDRSSVIDSSSSTTSTRTGLPSGLSSSVRPWGEVVVMVDTLSGSSEKTLSVICDFPEKHTGISQGSPDSWAVSSSCCPFGTYKPGHVIWATCENAFRDLSAPCDVRSRDAAHPGQKSSSCTLPALTNCLVGM